MHMCAIFLAEKNLSSVMCLIASITFVEMVRYPINTVYFYSRLDEEQLPPFTQRLTLWRTWLTQNMWVTDSKMLCSLPRSCLVHPIDRFGSEGRVQLWSGDIFNCVSCFLVKKHATFKWKDAISGFPVSPGSAEALIRCGGKIKYLLIAYFLGNICAKNCRNRTVYVKIIANCKGGTFFFETRCSLSLIHISEPTRPY